jgi:hypothetical protein
MKMFENTRLHLRDHQVQQLKPHIVAWVFSGVVFVEINCHFNRKTAEIAPGLCNFSGKRSGMDGLSASSRRSP